MSETLGALIWLTICALSVLFWWPVLMLIWQYWVAWLNPVPTWHMHSFESLTRQ